MDQGKLWGQWVPTWVAALGTAGLLLVGVPQLMIIVENTKLENPRGRSDDRR